MANQYIRLDIEQQTDKWARWRLEKIGASDAPVIMGENPWKSPEDLFHEKLGRKVFEGNEKTRRGQELEPLARADYIKRMGVFVKPVVVTNVERAWQAASLDGLSDDGLRVVEIKCGERAFQFAMRHLAVPKYNYGQLQHILAVTGLSHIHYFSYHPTKQPILLEVERDEKYIARLVLAELHFWERLSSALSDHHSSFGRMPKYIELGSSTRQLTYPDGSRYSGGLLDGKRHGLGTLSLKDGRVWEGTWVEDGIRNGKLLSPDGTVYRGDFRAFVPHGQGTTIYPNGTTIAGYRDYDLLIGRHRIVFGNGNVFEGEYLGDSKHRGVIRYVDGSEYRGEILRWRCHGVGIKTLKGGNVYDGAWSEDNFLHGHVRVHDDDSLYVGEQVDGEQHGRGVWTIADVFVCTGTWREGDLVDGEVVFEGGACYTGKFADFRPDGRGRITLRSGEFVECEWADGSQSDVHIINYGDDDLTYQALNSSIREAQRLLTQTKSPRRSANCRDRNMSGSSSGAVSVEQERETVRRLEAVVSAIKANGIKLFGKSVVLDGDFLFECGSEELALIVRRAAYLMALSQADDILASLKLRKTRNVRPDAKPRQLSRKPSVKTRVSGRPKSTRTKRRP